MINFSFGEESSALSASDVRLHQNPEDWIYGAVRDGEMSLIVREFDWSTTSLGPLRNWPNCLKCALSMCLTSQFAIVLMLGPDQLLVYNDAYRQYCGNKHPGKFGQPGRIFWPEMWDEIGPVIESVIKTKVATWKSDHLLPSNRWNYIEESYWTYSYSPIISEDGTKVAFYCVEYLCYPFLNLICD